MKQCNVPKCERILLAHGMCRMHYLRVYRHGSIENPSHEHGNHWQGGRSVNSVGYILIYQPDHPRASNSGYVFEHILIAESILDRYLPEGVEVHHFNEIRSDNSHTNLIVCEDHAYHHLLHNRLKAYRATGDPRKRRCSFCQQWDLPDSLLFNNRSRFNDSGARHRSCRNQYDRDMRQLRT